MGAWVARAVAGADTRVRVRALGKLELAGPRGSGRVRQVVLAERPDRLRLESLNLLGQTASLLVTDGAVYALYDGEGLQRGPVTADVLREYAGLDLDPEEAVELLVAAPVLPEGLPEAVLASGEQRLAEYRGRRLRFDATGELRAIEALDGAGQVKWRAEYDGWRDVSGGRYPFVMVFSFPPRELEARLLLEEAEPHPALDPSLFSLPGESRD